MSAMGLVPDVSMPRVSGGYRWLAEDDRGTPAAVEEMLKLLGKASRAHQLYLANNPTYHRALDLLRRSFEAVWAQTPELVLSVTENALLFDGRPAFQEPERTSDTLPWLLYKDGVRELRLLPGFELGEVEAAARRARAAATAPPRARTTRSRCSGSGTSRSCATGTWSRSERTRSARSRSRPRRDG